MKSDDALLIMSAPLLISLYLLSIYCTYVKPEELAISGEIFDIDYWENSDTTVILVADWGRYFLKGNWTGVFERGETYIINLRRCPRSPAWGDLWEVVSYYHVQD